MGIFGKTGSFWFHSKHAVGGTSPLGHSPVEGLLLLHPGLPSHTCRGTCWAGGRRVNGLLFGFMVSSLSSAWEKLHLLSNVKNDSYCGPHNKGDT